VQDANDVLVLGGYRCRVAFPHHRTGRLFFQDDGVAILYDNNGVEFHSADFVQQHVAMDYPLPA